MELPNPSNKYRKKETPITPPIIGPITTLDIDEIKAVLNEKTFSLVKAIPKDIKIRNIVAYVSNIVVLTIKFGISIS